MKEILLCLTVALALVGCAKKEEAGENPEAAAEQPSRVTQGDHGENIVTLDADSQKMIGLQTATLTGTKLSPEMKAFGRVLDPTALASAAADFISARTAAEVSQKELERVKTLVSQDNASGRALETAEAEAKRAAVQAGLTLTHLLTVAGKALADRTDLTSLVQSLASGEKALVQIDLPAGETLSNEPTNARIFGMSGSTAVDAEFIGPSTTVDPQTQSRGYIFLVQTNTARLVAGEAVTANLPVGGEPQNGVIVPRGAVVRHGGATFVYLETDGTNFVRHAVVLGSPLANGWFVTEGAESGDRVVVTGAQTVLSEELNSGGFLGGERD